VQENESTYTQTEICKAKEAYEFLRCSGYPSPEEAIHLSKMEILLDYQNFQEKTS